MGTVRRPEAVADLVAFSVEVLDVRDVAALRSVVDRTAVASGASTSR